MIERDYLLRMIQQLTSVLAKVLFNRELKQYNFAIDLIDEAGERFIGMKWSYLRTLSEQQLIEVLGYETHKYKMLAAAELFREESEILLEMGNEEESAIQGMKAFSLFGELIIEERDFLKIMEVERFTTLLHRLEEYELSPSLERKRFWYYDSAGDYARAEGILTGLLKKDRNLVLEAIYYYERLLKRTDGQLEEAGMKREDVERKLTNVKEKAAKHDG